MTFAEEADDFARSIGMTASIIGAQSRTYHSEKLEVAMTCYQDRYGDIHMELMGITQFLTLQIRSGKMMFKHPNTKVYMRHIHALVQEHKNIKLRMDALARHTGNPDGS